MDITPYMPIIVEATKFFFNEVGKVIDLARKYAKPSAVIDGKAMNENQTRTLSKEELLNLEQNPNSIQALLNIHYVKNNAQMIKSVMEQLEIHIKNLNHLETVQSQFGLLVPLHIKNEIENESTQIVEKSQKLQNLLSASYGKDIENI